MELTRQSLAAVTGAMLLLDGLALAALAERGNPYLTIVDRNAFGLRPIPPPAPPPEPPKAPEKPLAAVRLTGITTMLSTPRALFEVTEAPGKPPKKPILTLGERDGEVELLAIDIEKNQVTIRNTGIETNLVLEAAKSAPAAPTPAIPTIRPPGMPATAATPVAPTVITPASSGLSAGRGNVVVVGGATTPVASAPLARPASSFSAVASGIPATMGVAGAAGLAMTDGGALRHIPARVPRTQEPPSAQPQISGEEQYIIMKATEIHHTQQGIPFPPTPPIPGLTDQ